MANEKFYIVAADALPEVFLRVAEARRMLQVGEADTVGEAACKAGISRSAFYKYKDAVQPFQNMKAGRIITFLYALEGYAGCAVQHTVYFCQFRGKYTDHQSDHSHQRLRRCHRHRRDQRDARVAGGDDDRDHRRRGRAEV